MVDLDRLNLPKSTLPDENKVEVGPAGRRRSAQPAGGRREDRPGRPWRQPLGAWSLKVRPGSNGVAFNDPDLDLRGCIPWQPALGRRSGQYPQHLTRDGSRAETWRDVLKAWNFAPSATSRRFRMDIGGQWPGSPAYMALKRFSGSMDASLRRGSSSRSSSAQALRVFGLLQPTRSTAGCAWTSRTSSARD
ncbi:hypothetical protein ACPA9J_29450 [Pseudomonas aeruginosa]